MSYLEYASAGILMQNAFSSALQSGTSIVEDLNSGFLQKMLVTQVSRPAILLGRLATDAFRVTVQSIIILALAYALGFRLASGIPGVLLILFIIAFFGLAWSGISLALGLRTKSSETVFGIGAFLTFPLLFMSTALVPVRLHAVVDARRLQGQPDKLRGERGQGPLDPGLLLLERGDQRSGIHRGDSRSDDGHNPLPVQEGS